MPDMVFFSDPSSPGDLKGWDLRFIQQGQRWALQTKQGDAKLLVSQIYISVDRLSFPADPACLPYLRAVLWGIQCRTPSSSSRVTKGITGSRSHDSGLPWDNPALALFPLAKPFRGPAPYQNLTQKDFACVGKPSESSLFLSCLKGGIVITSTPQPLREAALEPRGLLQLGAGP